MYFKHVLEFVEDNEKCEFIEAEKEERIHGVNSPKRAYWDQITFSTDRYLNEVWNTDAHVVICSSKVLEMDKELPDKAFILVENPRLTFIKVCWEFYPPKNLLEPILVLPETIKIGENVVIGGDGFGYERDERGKLWKFPHYGWVEIWPNVEIGSNTCIDRGTFGATFIGPGTKIDNLVHIAHNVEIGNDSVVVAGTVIGGSAKIGKRVWLGINSSIREGVTVGDDAFVGMGAVVVKDVPAGMTVIGNPARKMEK